MQIPPVDTLLLFPQLDALLDEVLTALHPAEWQLSTVAGQWCVYDVALHLLDGNLRNLSMLRDGHFGISPANDVSEYAGLVDFINSLNREWVRVGQRLSPRVVRELLRWSGEQYYEAIQQLDPWEPAIFSVGWAGQAESPNWFHIAREYTERWHHQAQIRLAVGQEVVLYQPELYRPYLATSLLGLPQQLRFTAANVGDRLRVEITGSGGGEWVFAYGATGWALQREAADGQFRTRLLVPGALAWRLFTKAVSTTEALPFVQIIGDYPLGYQALGLVAVMA